MEQNRGLYIYNVEQDELRPALIRGKDFPRNIQSLATDQKNLYIGMKDEVGVTHLPPAITKLSPTLSFSTFLPLDVDSSESTLWIGNAHHLHRMNLNTKEIEPRQRFLCCEEYC